MGYAEVTVPDMSGTYEVNPSITPGHTPGVNTDVLVTTAGSVVLAYNPTSGTWEPFSPAGSGGGSSSIVWTERLPKSAMPDLTGWVSRSGTWVPGGTYGVNETATTNDNWLEFGTDLVTSIRAIRATVRLTSSNTNGWLGFGFTTDSTWSSGALSVGVNPNGKLQWDRYGSGGSSVTIPGGVALNTDIDLFVVQSSNAPNTFDVYVDGQFIVTITAASTVNSGRVGLYSRGNTGWWRDVHIWSSDVPMTPPPETV